jgi:putative membrane-bound dehydrogenase-like protein
MYPASSIPRRPPRESLFFTPLIVAAFAIVASAAARPMPPEQAVSDFRLPKGYRVELLAAEPEVVDPIAIAFDEDGRLWVVEMRDYPTLEPGAEPASRIRVLRDRDGDGRFETAATFADRLLFPTGLQPWRGGVIVTLAGEVAFFPDDNRDDRADRKETWYRGFATQNEQLRANHPTLAPDGWVYVAGGLRGGTIQNLRVPGSSEVSINGRDFAFHPVTGACRAVSGNGQFGLTFDDFGRRFTCSNRNPLVQVMIDERYLALNETYLPPTVVHDVAPAGADSRLYPRTRALTTSAQHAGQFTAACGVEIYRGSAMPNAYGHAFICEPTANLIHREAISAAAAALTAHRVDGKTEFLTSTDDWFRPVNLCTGPDGALYVVDMYRAVIEHPEWMPEEWRDRADMRNGDDRGRIYRIVADGVEMEDSSDSIIGNRRTSELLPLLSHANCWQRDTAARLLLERGDADGGGLQALALRAQEGPARCLALATLNALDVLSEKTLLASLGDQEAGVRELALKLAESRLADSPKLRERVLSVAADPDPRVRFQLALTVVQLPASAALDALQSIFIQASPDLWTRRAVALSSRSEAAELIELLLTSSASAVDSPKEVEHLRELIDAAVLSRNDKNVAAILRHVESLPAASARELLLQVAQSLDEHGASLQPPRAILAREHPTADAAVTRLFGNALSTLESPTANTTERSAAARLLTFGAGQDSLEALLNAINREAAPEVQLAAVQALSRRQEPELPAILLASFEGRLPSIRNAILDLLMKRPEWTMAVVDAVAGERLAAADIGASRLQALLQHPDPQVRDRAEKVLGQTAADRGAVISQYEPALALRGDRERGRAVFAAACSSCHRVGAEGEAIGPDIGDAAMKPARQLLTDILDPNQAIDANYISYTALTTEGLAHQGIIRAETDGGVVLQTADGATVTVLRDELQSLSGGGSLMPEGLERQISVEQMADLLAFLKMRRHAEASTAAED